jgi:mannosyltransferase OCH1-like enzyme
MIPKIIHYCWFGNNEKADLIKDCIKSWKKYLPDYKFIEWNETNTDLTHPFVRKAYKLKKWAFVSDYVRLQKIHEHGGVYLDTDMLLLRSLDSFLDTNMFIGCEDEVTINAAIFGAVKESQIIKSILEIYEKVEINNFTNFYEIAITEILTKYFEEEHGLIRPFDEVIKGKEIEIYPKDYFYSLPLSGKIDKKLYRNYLTKNSYAVHLWDASWISESELVLLRKGEYKSGLKQVFYSFNYQENKAKYIRKVLSALKQSLTN